nr:hypothetical protein Itr_chr08CG07830 [Ipomoea trifida]
MLEYNTIMLSFLTIYNGCRPLHDQHEKNSKTIFGTCYFMGINFYCLFSCL